MASEHLDAVYMFKPLSGSYESRPEDHVIKGLCWQAAQRTMSQAPIYFSGEVIKEWCCISLWISWTPVHDASEHGSQLVVIEFQDAPEMPRDPGYEVWEKHAADFSI